MKARSAAAHLFFLIFAAPAFGGAWGVGSFENDDALDLVGEVEREGVAAISLALKRVSEPSGYIEAPECSQAVAAAEIVAAAQGYPAQGLPESVRKWLKAQAKPPAGDLLQLAERAVGSVLDPKRSELAALWAETVSGKQSWRGAIAELQSRLELAASQRADEPDPQPLN